MKQVIRIEMANDNDVYEVELGKEIGIITDSEGRYIVTDDGTEDGEICWSWSLEEAEGFLQKEVADDNLVVKGFGINAGRKFWQLSEKTKSEILKMAGA